MPKPLRQLLADLSAAKLGACVVTAQVCSAVELRMAEADGRVYADGDGLTLVLRPGRWFQHAQACVNAVANLAALAQATLDPIYYEPRQPAPDQPPAG